MANYITNTEDLTSVANAIRSKAGTTESLEYPTGFVSAISGISGGGWTDDWLSKKTGITATAGIKTTGYLRLEDKIVSRENQYDNVVKFPGAQVDRVSDCSSWELGMAGTFDYYSDRAICIFGSDYSGEWYAWPSLEIQENGRKIWGGMTTVNNSWTTTFSITPESETDPDFIVVGTKYFFKYGWDGENAYLKVYNLDAESLVCESSQAIATSPHTYVRSLCGLIIGKNANNASYRQPTAIDLTNIYIKKNGSIVLGCKTTTIGD